MTGRGGGHFLGRDIRRRVGAVPERPTGTVTFLFTDIEGSTRLLQTLRERYADLLSMHAQIIRAAIEEFGGHEIDTQGDSFFAAFARARDAVNAAVAVQRALAAEPWPDGASVRVRMGIHTGEPLVGGERYVGMGVNRGARICAAGHGGQVLLSNTTRELVEDDLPDDIRVVDLGEHQLKDVKRPERIFQLEIDGLPSSFPPLRTIQPSAFEGREGELARAADAATRERATRRRIALAGAAVIAVAAAAAIGFVTLGGSSETTVAANSIVALGPSGSIEEVIPVGARPVALAASAGSLWAANLDDETVTRIDLSSRQAARTIPVGDAPTALAATESAVWVVAGAGSVSKIDPGYDRVTSSRSLTGSGAFFAGRTAARPMVRAFGHLWVVSPDGVVARASVNTARPTSSVGVGNAPSAIAAGAGAVWVTNSADGTLTRIDPATLLTTTIPVGHGPTGVSVNADGAWVANSGDNTVVRVNTGTNAVAATTAVGDGPTAVLASPGAVWVANAGDGTVMRLDSRSGEVTETISLGGTPNAFASADGQVWVAVAPAPPRRAEAGGVLRVTVEEDFPSLDPALGGAPQVHYATCANLVTYPDKPAPEGSRIVPEVAEAIPTPTAGGTTYTFRIREGFRFSPPSTEAVTATTFKHALERMLDPRMKSTLPFAIPSLSRILGYEEYVGGEARELMGVVAHGRTLTVRLSQPDGGILDALASGVACAVPSNAPVDSRGVDNLASAGPYYIASYTPRQQLILERNPNYSGERPRHLDEIVIEIGVASSRAFVDIVAGKADYTLAGPPRDAAPRLEAEYGPGSDAAKAGHQQYFVNEATGARFLHMNTSRRLFSDVRLRQAVNFAIDRQALVAEGRRSAEVNPFNAGKPTDDYLPPTTVGAKDFRLYPLDGPELRRAIRLAGRVRATAVMYTPNLSPWREEAAIIRRNLAPLGIEVEIEEFPIGDYFTRIFRRGEPFDLAVAGWGFGSTDPAATLTLFDGRLIRANQGQNASYFDDPAFNRELDAAASLSGAKRYREYNRLAFELARDHAPAAAIATTASRDFFSARTGCQVYQPVQGISLAALCLREGE
jgi:YVTN family beta-propeller protein